MTAIQAARQNDGESSTILLIDRRQKIGAKILISGGTRCNVTNREVLSSDYQGGVSHFVKHVLEAFTPRETIDFFGQMGVELVLEPTGKYFPTTHSGKTVLEALVRETERLGIELKTGVVITGVEKEGNFFRLSGKSETESSLLAKKVILTTGGLSYPETGSDGTGFQIARSFGHTIVDTAPALTPLTTDDEDWRSLSGITLPVKLSFYKQNRKKAEARGSFLFTHFGFSGPVVLDISRHWTKAGLQEEPRVEASFLPDQNEAALGSVLEKKKNANPHRKLKTVLCEDFSLPARFVEVFLRKAGVSTDKKIIRLLLNCPLRVTGVVGYKKAEVTAGGVDLKEVNVSTMESRKVPGLYFAGEILDVDGRIGGFNFQWAWSSGAVAGRAAVKSLS
ncbi:MAG: hypothetical protein A3C47_02075 [Omnitrophica bacterium RIFCSPHIGHO2_02_FULL_51_18]|nr:MAG: hypothetical protein A3C47_02075 [Omnitrophica bacterium RIFCSPHIGHO2_02_FULL_51_18]